LERYPNHLSETLLPLLEQGIKGLDLVLTENQVEKLIAFIRILTKWNKIYNLTAYIDLKKMITHHILDSLSILPFITQKNTLDVGSGAGLPGIPCAIARPSHNFVLLDSNGKKTRFMTQIIGELKITNASVIQVRIENYQPQHCFDNITARAFSSLHKILSLTDHLLCPDGQLLVMKGVYPYKELQEINKSANVHQLVIPGLHEQRHLVCIQK
jgi:16S rRNA (guanine527-N7)-methyltransferase